MFDEPTALPAIVPVLGIDTAPILVTSPSPSPSSSDHQPPQSQPQEDCATHQSSQHERTINAPTPRTTEICAETTGDPGGLIRLKTPCCRP